LQDDAHIFCTESQIGDEVKGVLDFLAYAYGIFGFEFDLELSTRPEKYLGELATWDKAEKLMAGALDSFGRKWQVRPHGCLWQRQRKGSGSQLDLL
jgi:threonyl-tRNA synthetase